jgi:hypothetical protein
MMATKSINLDTSQPSTRRQLYRAIRALPEGTYEVDLKSNRWKVSGAQRGYYWGYLVVEVGKLIGKDREQTDKLLNALFLSEPCTVAGQVVTVCQSLSALDCSGVSNYFSSIRMWAWEKYKVRLREPDPDKRKAV